MKNMKKKTYQAPYTEVYKMFVQEFFLTGSQQPGLAGRENGDVIIGDGTGDDEVPTEADARSYGLFDYRCFDDKLN